MTSKFDEVVAVLDEQPVPAPVPHAELVNTLTVISENVRKNRQKVIEQIGMLRQQIEVQEETLTQFNAMDAALITVLNDPNNFEKIAALLAMDSDVQDLEVQHQGLAGPQSGAGNTGAEIPADSASDSGAAATALAEAGAEGVDANGSPVADHASDAS